MHIYISICTYAYTYICVHTSLMSAAPHMLHAAPTPSYVHAFLSLFITTCTCLDYPTLLLLYSIHTTHGC